MVEQVFRAELLRLQGVVEGIRMTLSAETIPNHRVDLALEKLALEIGRLADGHGPSLPALSVPPDRQKLALARIREILTEHDSYSSRRLKRRLTDEFDFPTAGQAIAIAKEEGWVESFKPDPKAAYHMRLADLLEDEERP